jgi:hypothetical protein
MNLIDDYGNPATMIEVTIGGKPSPARAVHIPIGGRYGLNGCKVADAAMLEIQPWPAADLSTWRGAGFRWHLDQLRPLGCGLCVHGGGTYDPRIEASGAEMLRAFTDLNITPTSTRKES